MIYIMVNDYRSSTSEGFANTWTPYVCDSIAQRNAILRHGLPVTDHVIRYDDGSEEWPLSTNGLRVPTALERREADADPTVEPITQYRAYPLAGTR